MLCFVLWSQSGAVGVDDKIPVTAQLQHTSANLFKTDTFFLQFSDLIVPQHGVPKVS